MKNDQETPLIVVPFDAETVAIVEQALADPAHYLPAGKGASGGAVDATAVVYALRDHSRGLGLVPWTEERISLGEQ